MTVGELLRVLETDPEDLRVVVIGMSDGGGT